MRQEKTGDTKGRGSPVIKGLVSKKYCVTALVGGGVGVVHENLVLSTELALALRQSIVSFDNMFDSFQSSQTDSCDSSINGLLVSSTELSF